MLSEGTTLPKPLLVLGLLLLTMWTLKIYVITRAVLWLGRNGTGYGERMRKESALVHSSAIRQTIYRLLDSYQDTRFLPFGLNDYRLRRLREASHITIVRWAAVLCRCIFNGNYLAVFTFLWLFTASVHHGVSTSGKLTLYFVMVLAVVPLFAVFMLYIELITAYAKLRSYAYAFQMRQPSDNKYFDELRVIIGLLMRAVLAGSTAVYVSTVFLCSFEGQALTHPTNIGQHATLFVQSIYFSVVTIATVGYGDIAPANLWGQLIALSIILLGFALITFVLASLSAISSDA
jgi:voltage-gated potassium channel Kch